MINKTLKLNHMYSKSLNIYGDLGNSISLAHHANQLGIELDIYNTELGEQPQEADIYLIGGGQDEDQILVFEDLLAKKDFIVNEVNKNKIFILICGGYQLFGRFFVDGNGRVIEGLSILDIETKAPDYAVTSRCIGNIIVEMGPEFVDHWSIDTNFSKYIVGFENHGGQTKLLSDQVKPIGIVIKGFGNNSFDRQEGAIYMNIIGSYCHGSLLPKNPHLASAIIRKAFKNQYKQDLTPSDIDFTFEKKAHEHILTLQ